MQKILLVLAMAAASFSSMAQTASGANSGPNSQNTTVTTQSGATANNGGQSLTYAPVYQTPADTTAKIEQTINGNTTSNQVISGGTHSSAHQTFGDQKIKNTPSVSGAPLVSSNDTCMGSASGAVNVPGFGLGIGKTYTDSNCVMLKNSRELWNMGMKAAAMALMCTDSANREALELTGFVCPQTERENARRNQITSVQAAGEPTDPIVRKRMGLAALPQ